MVGKLFLVALLLGLTACSVPGGNQSTGVPAPPEAGMTVCSEPRPMVCTMEYRPVCASLVAGGEKTYPSGCNACADIAVQGWLDGPCEVD